LKELIEEYKQCQIKFKSSDEANWHNGDRVVLRTIDNHYVAMDLVNLGNGVTYIHINRSKSGSLFEIAFWYECWDLEDIKEKTARILKILNLRIYLKLREHYKSNLKDYANGSGFRKEEYYIKMLINTYIESKFCKLIRDDGRRGAKFLNKKYSMKRAYMKIVLSICAHTKI
jgi:hypothetical protein